MHYKRRSLNVMTNRHRDQRNYLQDEHDTPESGGFIPGGGHLGDEGGALGALGHRRDARAERGHLLGGGAFAAAILLSLSTWWFGMHSGVTALESMG